MLFFPSKVYHDAGTFCDDYYEQISRAWRSIDRAKVHQASLLLSATVLEGAIVYACGNGGSAAIANHLACDCLKGAQTDTGLKPRVQSLSANIELVTAIANDISFADVFAYQVATLARPGDLLIAISSSGNSPNILKALSAARSGGVRTLAMVGFDGGKASQLADVVLHANAHNYGIVEDVHQSLMHLLSQYLRQAHMNSALLGTRKF